MCMSIDGYTPDQLAEIFCAPEYGGALRDLLKGPIDNYAIGNANKATARMEAMKLVDAAGIDPFFGNADWLDLVLETCSAMQAGARMAAAETKTTRSMFPAWRLERFRSRSAPRNDWTARWCSAGESIGWEGAVKDEMVALKNSPIWQALGDGAGGFKDTLGNPYPPFAIGSGMAWSSVAAEECEGSGLDAATAAHSVAPLSAGEKEIAEAVKKLGPDFLAELRNELGAME